MEHVGDVVDNSVEEGHKAIDAVVAAIHVTIKAASKSRCDSLALATEDEVVEIKKPRHQLIIASLTNAAIDTNQPIEKIIAAAHRSNVRWVIPHLAEMEHQLLEYRHHLSEHAASYLRTISQHGGMSNYLANHLGPNLCFHTVYTNGAWRSMDVKHQARVFDLLNPTNPMDRSRLVEPNQEAMARIRAVADKNTAEANAVAYETTQLVNEVGSVAEELKTRWVRQRETAPYEKLAHEWEHLAATKMVHHPGYSILGAADAVKTAVKTIAERVRNYCNEVAKCANLQDANNMVNESVDACIRARHVVPGEEMEVDTHYLALDTAVGHWRRTARHDLTEITDLGERTAHLVPELRDAVAEATRLGTARLVEAERVAGPAMPSRSQCLEAAARRSQRIIDAINADAARLASLLDDAVLRTLRTVTASSSASEKTLAMLAIGKAAGDLSREVEAATTDEAGRASIAHTVCMIVERERAAVSDASEHTTAINDYAKQLSSISKHMAEGIRAACKTPRVERGVGAAVHVNLAPHVGRLPINKMDIAKISARLSALGSSFDSDDLRAAVGCAQKTLAQPTVTIQDLVLVFSAVMSAILRSGRI